MLGILAMSAALAGEWRIAGGGEINADPHGVADLEYRDGPWSAALLTDTLDLRWTPEGDRGKAWVAARGEFGAAGLLISPWTDGAPDPARALRASYAGGEAGAARYLPRGLYAGGYAGGRRYWFGAMDQTAIPAPDPRAILSADAVVGLHRPLVRLWVRGGADLDPADAVMPHVAGKVQAIHYLGPIAPLVEIRAGLAEGQDYLTTTRIGGLNPYVVPIAGAAWAEWRAEDYAAARLGLRIWPVSAFFLAPVADLAAFDGQRAAGLGMAFLYRQTDRYVHGPTDWSDPTRYTPPTSITPPARRWSVEADAGYSPWISRQDGAAWSLWLRVSVEGTTRPPLPIDPRDAALDAWLSR